MPRKYLTGGRAARTSSGGRDFFIGGAGQYGVTRSVRAALRCLHFLPGFLESLLERRTGLSNTLDHVPLHFLVDDFADHHLHRRLRELIQLRW